MANLWSWNRYTFAPLVCMACFLSVQIVYNRTSFNGKQNDISCQGNPCKILAFGDSLTKGIVFSHNQVSLHPYTIELEKLLSETSKSKKVMLRNLGVSGERALDMPSRLDGYLDDDVNLVIILAGTNDYASTVAQVHNLTKYEVLHELEKQPSQVSTKNLVSNKFDKIYRDILQLHELCHKKGITTGVVTLPDIKFEEKPIYSVHAGQRKKINENLRRFAEKNIGRTVFIDLASHIPYINKNAEFRKKYWCDGLHFTEQGYDKMGMFIYSKLKERNFL